MEIHGIGASRRRAEARAVPAEKVGLDDLGDEQVPHEFSGASASGSPSPAASR